MTKFSKCPIREVFGLCIMLSLSGCAATEIALEHKDLKVQTQMSATVFLDVEDRTEKSVFLDVRNTSDKDLDVLPLIEARLTANGYVIKPLAKDAFYILQLNILQVGVADPSALHSSLYAGWGGAVGGAVAGSAIGAGSANPMGAYNGAAVGGFLGSAGELIAGSLVKDVTYSMISDLQIMERTDEAVKQSVNSNLVQGTGTQVVQTSESTRNRRKYQTRIVSTANQVNLDFKDALPPLEEQLAKSVAGIF